MRTVKQYLAIVTLVMLYIVTVVEARKLIRRSYQIGYATGAKRIMSSRHFDMDAHRQSGVEQVRYWRNKRRQREDEAMENALTAVRSQLDSE